MSFLVKNYVKFYLEFYNNCICNILVNRYYVFDSIDNATYPMDFVRIDSIENQFN